MLQLNWNKERHRTRDLLLEYDKTIIPFHLRAGGLNPVSQNLSIVYPWENTALSIFSNQLYKIAIIHGYTGTEKEFLNRLANYTSDKQIIFETFNNFPQYGSSDKLYFDIEEKVLYCWDNNYIPVNATLIADTIIEGGEA